MDKTTNELRQGRKRGGHNNPALLRMDVVTRAVNAARLAGYSLVVDESGQISLMPMTKGTNQNEPKTEDA